MFNNNNKNTHSLSLVVWIEKFEIVEQDVIFSSGNDVNTKEEKPNPNISVHTTCILKTKEVR